MPDIGFRWKWNDDTQDLVLVFYFPCDKENIREEPRLGKSPQFSWAPTHIEHGLIGALLSLANIINGFPRDKKHRLVIKLRKKRNILNEATVKGVYRIIKTVS